MPQSRADCRDYGREDYSKPPVSGAVGFETIESITKRTDTSAGSGETINLVLDPAQGFRYFKIEFVLIHLHADFAYYGGGACARDATYGESYETLESVGSDHGDGVAGGGVASEHATRDGGHGREVHIFRVDVHIGGLGHDYAAAGKDGEANIKADGAAIVGAGVNLDGDCGGVPRCRSAEGDGIAYFDLRGVEAARREGRGHVGVG